MLGRRHGVVLTMCLALSVGCGDDVVTPDPLPPARLVSGRRFGPSPEGVFFWGEEIHAQFDSDPGAVALDHRDGESGWPVVGSGTLRAFVALEAPIHLVWGDGESYDVGVDRVVGDEFGPELEKVAPDMLGSTVAAAELNAEGITLSFSQSVDPAGGRQGRLIPRWVIEFEVEDVTAGGAWKPSYSVTGTELTVLPGQANAFAPATSDYLHGGVTDAFHDGFATPGEMRFVTE